MHYTVVECGTPANGLNTEPVDSGIYLAYKQTYIYTCLEGYSTENQVKVTCVADMALSSLPPHCSKCSNIRLFVFNLRFSS